MPIITAPIWRQAWTLDETKSLFVEKTRYQCIDVSNYGAVRRRDDARTPRYRRQKRPILRLTRVRLYRVPEQGPRLDTFACAHSLNQQWERRIVPQCTAHMVAALGVACSQLVNPSSGNCLTKVTTSGAAIGLDAGTTMVVAQARPCLPPGAPSQTFDLVNGDQSGFPKAFPIRSPVDNGDSDRELCLQPWVAKEYAARPGAEASGQPACLACFEHQIGQQ